MHSAFLGEFLGTMIMILLGNGVVANVVLRQTKGEKSGWMVITTGWCFAVMAGVFTALAIGSDGHLNPAVTVGVAVSSGDWSRLSVYVPAQVLGAMAGAALVWLTYLSHWKETPEPLGKLACFSTIPAIRAPLANILTEIIGTFVLVLVAAAISSKYGTGAEYPATINMPLATGMNVSTGHDGQAEIQFEDGSVLRLAPNSSLALTSLDADSSGNYHTSATVLHGLIYAELRATAKFTYSLNADDDVISPLANATLRIDMDKPPAVVAVFDGTVQVTHAATEEDKAKVAAGLTITADPSDNTRFFTFKGIKRNSWDDWNQSRDQDAAATLSAKTSARDDYAGQQGYGWSDLDQNGTWYDVPGQGQVWQPDEAQDLSFDPYGYGSWVPYPGVGYVWASGYGWGWTPFRCGSWSYWNTFGWGWSPLSSCGLGGWGFGGVVYIVNIVRPPLHYHLPTRPVHPGYPHPVPVGHPLHLLPETPHPVPGPRMIAGVLAHPLAQVHSAALFGGPVTGAALLSNFPVDRMTHQPVTGIVGTSMPGGVYRFTLPPPAAMNGGTSYHPPMRPAPTAPPPHYSAPTYTPQHSAPAPHSAPPPAAPHR